MKRAAAIATLFVLGCASTKTSGTRTVSATKPTTRVSSQQVRPQITAEGECVTAELFDAGASKGAVCVADAQAKGYTIVDLTESWTPTIFQPTRDGRVPNFRQRYLELALEKEEGIDALAELYGIVPAFSIVKSRLADDARHACHAAIDPKAILLLDRTWSQSNAKEVKAAMMGHLWLGKQLQKEADKRKVAVAALEADPKWRERFIRWQKLDQLKNALLTAQQKLRCEGWLLDKDVNGEFGWRMGDAVEHFQRRNFLMPTERLDKETREAMQLDTRELDFRLSLRVLRERVVEAAGLLEDGTAGTGPQPVLGRVLDPEAMRAARGHKPMANAAPDLVGAATEAAAKQLGWIGPNEVRAFFDKHPHGARVAIALPPVPAYYKPHMELSVVIDRGDVYYEDRPPPFKRVLPHRPTLVVYVDDNGVKRPLVRWPTTIGGWSEVRRPSGFVVQKWKESDVGPRIWRDLTVGPTWLPPKTTPDKDLVKPTYPGWDLKTELFGPGPRSAYGMVLLEHLQIVKLKDGERLDDNGIGTHGSSSVTSIVHGTSHGCHRLYNQLAVRLGDFLLQHREHVVKGEQKTWYKRNVWHHESFKIDIESRGFQYELTPPVHVDVTKGRILSKRKKPPKNSAPARP